MDRFVISALISNSFYFVLVLLVLLIVFHILLIHVKVTRLHEKGWKVVDYIWLGCAAFGLIFLASDARTSLASIWVPIEQSRADSSFRIIKRYAKDAPNSYHCTFSGQRTKNSPPDFDLITKDFQTACQWRHKLAQTISKSLNKDHPRLDFFDMPSATFYKRDFIESDLQWLEDRFNDYEQDVKRLEQTRARAEVTALELLLKLVAPMLICVALALRITKVTAELKGIKR